MSYIGLKSLVTDLTANASSKTISSYMAGISRQWRAGDLQSRRKEENSMAYYSTCPDCGSNLDPGEPCACQVNRHQIMITIPKSQYDKMVKSLDEAMQQIQELKGQLKKPLTKLELN